MQRVGSWRERQGGRFFQTMKKRAGASPNTVWSGGGRVGRTWRSRGTGAWEAALVNTMSPGDRVLMFETGHFATLWKKMAAGLGLEPEFLGLPGCASSFSAARRALRSSSSNLISPQTIRGGTYQPTVPEASRTRSA